MPGSRITAIEKADFGEFYFGECLMIRQIRQRFLPPKLYGNGMPLLKLAGLYSDVGGVPDITLADSKLVIRQIPINISSCVVPIPHIPVVI